MHGLGPNYTSVPTSMPCVGDCISVSPKYDNSDASVGIIVHIAFELVNRALENGPWEYRVYASMDNHFLDKWLQRGMRVIVKNHGVCVVDSLEPFRVFCDDGSKHAVCFPAPFASSLSSIEAMMIPQGVFNILVTTIGQHGQVGQDG